MLVFGDASLKVFLLGFVETKKCFMIVEVTGIYIFIGGGWIEAIVFF